MEIRRSYFAIIPANVRYDKRLPANAKLLYGEITALCNSEGYCWATNKYFSELYGVSIKTVSLWLKALIECGYIKSEMVYIEGTKGIEHRYLTIVDPPIEKNVNTYGKKGKGGIEKNVNTPMEKKVKDNNTYINNTFNNKQRKNERYDFEELEARAFKNLLK